MTISELTTWFEAMSALFAGLAAIRMVGSGLHARYRFLSSYLFFLVPFSAWPLCLDSRSAAYYWTWIYSEPLNWIFQILVVRELCGLVLERYRGLCTLGRWGMYAGIGIAGAISLASLLPHIPNRVSRRSHLLSYMQGGERGVYLALGLFLLLMMVLVSRYPVPLSRNVLLNAVIFTILFFSNSLAALLHTIFDLRIGHSVDAGLGGLGVITLVAWLFFLTPRGEEIRVELVHLQPEREEHVLRYLDDLNRLVLNLGRS
jgi:hypothetical protein